MTTVAAALTALPAWHALAAHRDALAGTTLRELFARDPGRHARYSLEAAGLFLDYGLCAKAMPQAGSFDRHAD